MKRQIFQFHLQFFINEAVSMRKGLYSLLLVEMADQRGFDLQFEFMLLIIWAYFVVLQT